MDRSELIKCGTKGDKTFENVMEILNANKTEGQETITFVKADWELVKPYMEELQTKLHELSQLTHVKGAHGLCKVTTCQWEELSTMRERYKVNEKKIETLHKLLDGALSFVDRLVQEKLLAADGWWMRKLTEARREVEDIKRT